MKLKEFCVASAIIAVITISGCDLTLLSVERSPATAG